MVDITKSSSIDLELQDLFSRMKENEIDYNQEILTKAYYYTKDSHKGQKRKSGEPYFIHPVNVALILIDLNMDQDTIIAGLLHDVIEDTDATYEDISREFSEEIADLVDGVTKLKKISYKSKEESQAENVRKMIIAMSDDIRVIIVKLADRLHNMRTLEYMSANKQYEKATETLEIYAPLADRLGISAIKTELEDLSLMYLEPANYREIKEKIKKNQEERQEYIDKLIKSLREELKEVDLDDSVIYGRPKHLYSIYKKMKTQEKTFEEIFDLTAIRVLVDSIRDCYTVLGTVHSLWKPIEGRFKDYIAMPKANMYQSIHTTVIGPEGEIFEVQIRTHEMHRTAEYGIAAHWKYKKGGGKEKNFAAKLSWLEQLKEWQKEETDPTEFMETLKGDFFSDEVYVYSPDGDVIDLPNGSVPLDFAYKIHSAVGNNCVGAKINGKMVPLNTKLKNGDIVEIITSTSSSGPSQDWLDIVQSRQARNKIRQFFKKSTRDQNIVEGRNRLEKEIKKLGYDFLKILKPSWIKEVAEDLSFKDIDDMYAAVGYGSLALTQIIPKLERMYQSYYKEELAKEEFNKRVHTKHRTTSSNGVKFKDVDNIGVKFAKCCSPVPGDDIIGYVTRGSGVSIHRTDCPNMQNINKNRVMEVKWDTDANTDFNIHVHVLAYDRVGYLADLWSVLSDMQININSLNAKAKDDNTFLVDLVVEIKGQDQLKYLKDRILNIDGTIDFYRVKAQ